MNKMIKKNISVIMLLTVILGGMALFGLNNNTNVYGISYYKTVTKNYGAQSFDMKNAKGKIVAKVYVKAGTLKLYYKTKNDYNKGVVAKKDYCIKTAAPFTFAENCGDTSITKSGSSWKIKAKGRVTEISEGKPSYIGTSPYFTLTAK